MDKFNKFNVDLPRYRYGGTLERQILRFVRQFGVHRVICSDSFYCVPALKTLWFTIVRYDTDQELIDHIQERYDVDITDWFFVFSLLHEVGHLQTFEQLSQDDIIMNVVSRELIAQFIDDSEAQHNAYFNLHEEDLANRWAIQYIAEHTEECWNFQRKCYNTINHIYQKPSFHL